MTFISQCFNFDLYLEDYLKYKPLLDYESVQPEV